MSDTKATRLSKIAREFNVGISTIVDFLKKKGLSIDPNPNSKVPPEFYDDIVKEYSSEANVKKESEKLSYRILHEKKETISIDDIESAQPEEEPEEAEEVLIKDHIVHPKVKEELFEPDKIELDTDLKVVGKIDLSKLQPKHVEKQETEAIPTPKEQEKVKPVVSETSKESVKESTQEVKKEAVVETPVEKAPVEKAPVEKAKPIVKPAAPEPSKIQEEKNITIEKPKVEPTQAVLNIETEKKAPEIIPEVPVAEEKEKENEIKVVGHIDLSSINQRTRPAKKTRKQRDEERRLEKEKHEKFLAKIREERAKKKSEQFAGEEKVQSSPSRPEHGTAKPVEEVQHHRPYEKDFIKSDVQKLTGPTVVGKIDLPDFDKKKPVASSNGEFDHKKRKRKRIRKDQGKNVTLPNADKKIHPKQQVGAVNTSNGGNHESKQRLPLKKKRRPLRAEITEEEVQKQIKDTLARLTTHTKSKGSKHRKEKRDAVNVKQQEELAKIEKDKNTIKVTEFVSVNELATMMNVPVNEVIATCMNLGLFVSINQRLDAETMALVADEFNYKVEFISVDVQEAIKEEEDNTDKIQSRPPIVTVMGHVDHGKTKLLDYIRRANVVAGEAGGITQHIGAYSVVLKDGRHITFLDTPGHEAFTAMRARGAQATDIAIIVVAADDGVMPQTVEAINHAQAAGVPIVFAINKVDKPESNPDRIKEELANMNLLVEDWGGKYQSQEISAKTGLNVDVLLDKVLLEAELLDLKADPTKKAIGTIIESALDKGRGYTSTVLVAAGTLKVGDVLLAGNYTGHVKAMYNERNNRIEEAGPSTPALVLGLDGAPQAGDKFNVMDSFKEAKEIANRRNLLQREQGLRTQKHITLDEIGRRIAIGNFKEINVIVKGDVDGSVEALSDSLIKLSTPEIQINVIHKAVGQISESDVLLAAASNAIIIGFQVRPSFSAKKIAEKEEIDIRLYSIIYDAINDLKDAMEGMLSPEIKEEIAATLDVKEVFNITKVGTVAGCMVKEGKITRSTKVRIIRDGIVVHSGALGSLKRFKDDAKEVVSGQDCGLNLVNFNDIKVGDVIEGYREIEIKKKLK
ncbi:MAG: translation initiation factor IF-2 [Bacteroidota bacterium]|nr:translation initiation factor IF-2 [Bacteroidota bacterium]